MKLSVVLSIHNRSDLFKIGILSLAAQNFKDWEIVLIDDQSTENLAEIYKPFDVRIQHIRIDPRSHPFYRGYHTPALSTNIGIKQAKGDVLCFSQPEIILAPDAFKRGYGQALQDTFVFGNLQLTTGAFTKWLKLDIRAAIEHDFGYLWDKGIELAGHTFPPREMYWMMAFLKKEHALAINGVDEEYMKGVYAEDDDFKERLRLHGILPERNAAIRGIHIDHSHEGDLYKKQDRTASFWNAGAAINRKRYYDFIAGERTKERAYANIGREWGEDKYIEWIKEQ